MVEIKANKIVKVAIATVTYGDRADLLGRMLDGVFNQTVQNQIAQVVVCDNGANKKSKALLADISSREPKLHVVSLLENTGSAYGFREAIGAAAASGHEYIWCLDDDNRPHPDALERLLDALQVVSADAALLALRNDRPEYVNCVQETCTEGAFGRQHSFLGFSILDLPKKARRLISLQSSSVKTKGELPKSLISIPYAPYGGFLFKTEQLSDVGLPRADLYLYSDDHEFTFRFTKQGHPIYLVPDSRIEDLERSWHRRRPDKICWSRRILPTNNGEDVFVRQYYTVRNRAFFETHSLEWGRSILYWLNASSYLVLLSVQAFLLWFLGYRLAWQALTTVFQAARDGWQSRLGRVREV